MKCSTPTTQTVSATMANRVVRFLTKDRQMKEHGTPSKFMATAWFHTTVNDATHGTYALLNDTRPAIIATHATNRHTTWNEVLNVAPNSWDESEEFRSASTLAHMEMGGI